MNFWFLVMLNAHSVPRDYLISRKPLGKASDILGEPAFSDAQFGVAKPYRSEPVLPFVAWGLRFDEDLMIALKNDSDWGMIEVAKVNLPGGEGVWFTLDSKKDGRQYVGLPSTEKASVMAQAFPAPSYDSNLVVVESEMKQGRRLIEVRYKRLDEQDIHFSMEAWPANKPPSRRNGHAMNHSQGQVLAILDIFSLRLQKPQWERSVQRIFGVPIAGQMRQTVSGVRQGQWRQNGLQWMPLTESSHTFTLRTTADDKQLVLSTDSQFPVTKYRFDKTGENIELRSIQILQNDPQPIAELQFNPSLPDLRYGSPLQTVCAQMVLTLRKAIAYQQGKVCFEPLTDNTTRVRILSDEPQWAKERPVISWVTTTADHTTLHSAVMASNAPSNSHSYHSLSNFESTIWTWKQIGYVWDKRPHRLSWLSLMFKGGEIIRNLGGGTWANGKFASDKARMIVDFAQLHGGEFASVLTPELPLNQSSTTASEVSTSHWLHLKFNRGNKKVLPWIQGFDLSPGPFHEKTGITTAGFKLSIDEVILKDDGADIHISMAHRFGSVPDRFQQNQLYSAIGKIQIGLALLPEQSVISSTIVDDDKLRRGGLFPKQLEMSPAKNAVHLVQQYDWHVTNEQKHRGRYLRGLGMTATTDTSGDVFDNAGPITKKTKIRYRKVLAWSNALTVQQSKTVE